MTDKKKMLIDSHPRYATVAELMEAKKETLEPVVEFMLNYHKHLVEQEEQQTTKEEIESE